GTIKAALMATARPIFQAPGNPYPWRSQGAGAVNASAALEYILNASRKDGALPDLLLPVPSDLPFSPLVTLFQGQHIGFNLSLVSSGAFQINSSLSEILLSMISFPTTLQTFGGTSLLPIWFSIPKGCELGLYTGVFTLSTDRDIELVVNVSFEVKKPVFSVLFDETKSGLVNEIQDVDLSENSIQDSWGKTSFLFGAYREIFFSAAKQGISFSPHRTGSLDNLSFLSEFDSVILADPATRLSGNFTDWIDATVDTTLGFSSSEIDALRSLVVTKGKNLIILISYPAMTNVSEINRLLADFNLTYVAGHVSSRLSFSGQPGSNLLTTNVDNIDYIGGMLKGDRFLGTLWGRNDKMSENGFASWHNPAGGNLLVSGSSFFLSNLALISSKVASNNSLFAL
ncbi:MAG TPA: hypothetical protein VJ044_01490, partial [Candidatus Hodarchaeales archaeon]|nr:hypothetical protein [Candidatus Hodarchaeales archaeon]